MDESILNRINTIKNVLEEDINNPIRILNEIKKVHEEFPHPAP